MKNILVILLILGASSCSIHKHDLSEELTISKLSKQELYFLIAMEFVQQDNKGCSGDCKVNISCTFEFFDTCLEAFDSDYYYSIGLDYTEKSVYPLDSYYIKSFGDVIFRKQTDKTDYIFSPVLLDEKTRRVTVQVKNRKNENFIAGFNILNNKLYFSYVYPYPNDNCYW